MAETPEIPPALTPEEWGRGAYISRELEVHLKTPGLDGSKRLHVNVKAWPLGGTMGDPRDLYALAALCLYGQPFGFTREDVDLMARCADGCDGNEDDEPDDAVFPDGIRMRRKDVARLRSLAARLAALLPPEGT